MYTRQFDNLYEEIIGRKKGKGIGNERQQDGGVYKCICPKCKKEYDHMRGEPCVDKKCDDCDINLVGINIKK